MTTTTIDQTAATAVIDWGDSSSWVGAKPPTGIGIALLEGSWPELDAAAVDALGVPIGGGIVALNQPALMPTPPAS